MELSNNLENPVQQITEDSPRRLKVLISAYSVAPHRGSEPAVGWNVVKEVSKYHDVWVITRSDRAELIEPEINTNPLPNVQWFYYDLPYWARFWRVEKRGQRLHYQLWQWAIRDLAKQLQEQVNFDLIHHVTYAKYWSPSLLTSLPVPFLWGPVGGGESTPRPFYSSLSTTGKLYEYVRVANRSIGHNGIFVRATARGSTYALATTAETADALRQIGTRHVEIRQAIGMDSDEIARLKQVQPPGQGNLRFLSVGNLLGLKGFHLGIQAFAAIHHDYPDAEYWLIGDGPERKTLEVIIKQHGIESKVRFFGKIPREEVLECFAQCDVLVHPSLHDSGGGVCLEAMAAKRPVICLQLGGPGELVSDESGIRVAAENPDQAIRDIAVAMRRFAEDRSLIQQMGTAAQQRVEDHFSWEKKGEYLAQLYHRVVAEAIKR